MRKAFSYLQLSGDTSWTSWHCFYWSVVQRIIIQWVVFQQWRYKIEWLLSDLQVSKFEENNWIYTIIFFNEFNNQAVSLSPWKKTYLNAVRTWICCAAPGSEKVVRSSSSLTSIRWGRKIVVPGAKWDELHPCLDIMSTSRKELSPVHPRSTWPWFLEWVLT